MARADPSLTVRYGVNMSSIDQGLYKIGFGTKKKIMTIKKIMKKSKLKNARQAARSASAEL
jgi:hypothetical protein